MQDQYCVLGYRIDLYFHNYKSAIEVDEFNHCDRSIDNGIGRQRPIEERLGCKLIISNFDENGFYTFKSINEIHRHI